MAMSFHYECLFLLNRCLEQVGEIIEQFRQDGCRTADGQNPP
jgi:hypothetical protein